MLPEVRVVPFACVVSLRPKAPFVDARSPRVPLACATESRPLTEHRDAQLRGLRFSDRHESFWFDSSLPLAGCGPASRRTGMHLATRRSRGSFACACPKTRHAASVPEGSFTTGCAPHPWHMAFRRIARSRMRSAPPALARLAPPTRVAPCPKAWFQLRPGSVRVSTGVVTAGLTSPERIRGHHEVHPARCFKGLRSVPHSPTETDEQHGHSLALQLRLPRLGSDSCRAFTMRRRAETLLRTARALRAFLELLEPPLTSSAGRPSPSALRQAGSRRFRSSFHARATPHVVSVLPLGTSPRLRTNHPGFSPVARVVSCTVFRSCFIPGTPGVAPPSHRAPRSLRRACASPGLPSRPKAPRVGRRCRDLVSSTSQRDRKSVV